MRDEVGRREIATAGVAVVPTLTPIDLAKHRIHVLESMHYYETRTVRNFVAISNIQGDRVMDILK